MTRAYKAGLAIGQGIIEMVHFYQGIFAALDGELERRNISSASHERGYK